MLRENFSLKHLLLTYEKAVKKAWNEETASIMTELSEKLNTTEFKSEILKEEIHHLVEEKGLGFGKVMMPLRLALVGELKRTRRARFIRNFGQRRKL